MNKISTIIIKLRKKYPDSKIIIEDNKIMVYNPHTGITKLEAYLFATNEGEIKFNNKQPLFKSTSLVNVFSAGIPSFKSFGKSNQFDKRRKNIEDNTEIQLFRIFLEMQADGDFEEKTFEVKSEDDKMRERLRKNKDSELKRIEKYRKSSGFNSLKNQARLKRILINMKNGGNIKPQTV